MKDRIGILGGTFNPVHVGHLSLADDASAALGLDRVLFVPCAEPSHKTPEYLAPSEDRLEMLRIALADRDAMEVSDVDVRRGGVTYTVDTLRDLNERYPHAEFFFLIGADSLLELDTWKQISEVLERCEIVAMARPGYPVVAKEDIPLGAPWRDRLWSSMMTTRETDVSSSGIRRRIREGKLFADLVPQGVDVYISNKGLYR